MAAKSVTITDFLTQLPGKIDPEDATVYLFPQVVSTNSRGSKTYWRIMVRLVVNPGKPTEHFLPLEKSYFDSKTDLPAGACAWLKVISKTGEKGKIRETAPDIVCKGKNAGKANQTNAFTQGLRDALSKHNMQIKKTETQTAEEKPAAEDEADDNNVKLYPPMLAQNLKKLKKSVDYTEEVYVQRKYNGVRVVSVMNGDGDVLMYSRRRNLYPGFEDIKADLLKIFDEYYDNWSTDATFGGTLYLDGEVYKHGVNLQDIAGVARNEDKSMDLEYYLYDLFVPEHPDLTYPQRKRLFDDLAGRLPALKRIKWTEAFRVADKDDVKRLYDQFTSKAEGYEGAMVRLPRPYRYSYNDYHSDVLLKLKGKEDAEFNIVGYEPGTRGKSAGTLIMKCVTPTGAGFNVMMGEGISIEKAKELYKKMSEVEANGKTYFENHYLGKPLIVEYEELSKDGVPLRAKTLMVVRNYE